MVGRAVESWGRRSREVHDVVALSERGRCLETLQRCMHPALAYGNGRSYGDACLNPGGTLIAMRGLDRFIDFDVEQGVIECEAGVRLDEILAVTLPHGWFLPVLPGTQYVTVGGAIANDVHGKNHHSAGTFSCHLESLDLVRSDGRSIRCGPAVEPDWFAATAGGLGLTGIVTRARIRLMRVPGPWIATRTTRFASLDEFFAIAAREAGTRYTVAWVDCTGEAVRGVFFSGEHAQETRPAPSQRRRRVPFTPPVSLINRVSLRLFNALYGSMPREHEGIAHYRQYFFPLDGIEHWNRIYGPRGFFQYQCVVPVAEQEPATATLLRAIRESGTGSFLTVLKTFGARASPGLLSFPMAGTTLAMDFPDLGEKTQALFASLDDIVEAHGGRLYPAKDARMTPSMFARGYPRLADFLPCRDPAISSAMSRRLMGS